MRITSILLLLLAAALGAPVRMAAAQTVETPVPFDSTGRLQAITPPLAARLRLGPPAWTVEGDYREARLYQRSEGGFVLIVFRPSGALERLPLAPDEGARLRGAVTAAAVGERARTIAEGAALISEPAGFAFTRNQLLLGLGVYGPSAASLLADESGSAAGASYFLVAGATFFAAAQFARSHPVSRAQNQLSTHGATRGALIGGGVAYLLDVDDQGAALAVLGGALGGTALGLGAARGMTDAEATGSGFVADAAALTTAGLAGAAGLFDGDDKAAVGATIGAALAGYALGPRYARRAGSTVTAGDVLTLYSTGALGALAGLGVSAESGDEETTAALATAGFLAGVVAGDRLLGRRYDFTPAEGRLLGVGAAAGALMGVGVAIAAEADNVTVPLLVTAVAGTTGAAMTTSIMAPARDGRRLGAAPNANERRARLELAPAPLALLAAGQPGRYPIGRVTF